MTGADDTTGASGCPRRGRPRLRRVMSSNAELRCYKPCCCEDNQIDGVTLQPEELELIRLIDIEGLEQEEAASRLGVSRKTVWRDLHAARRKIADALVNGKGISVSGCHKAAEGNCPLCPR